jgi:hypothetical protein
LFKGKESLNERGVYHAFLKTSRTESDTYLFTVDENTFNQFRITENISLEKADNFYNSSKVAPGTYRPNSDYNENYPPEDDGRELEEIGGYKSSITKNFIYPRLFVISSDGSGYELLTKE